MSTTDDYWSFVSMVLAGGAGPEGPILSPEAIALMTTDRLTAAQRKASSLFLGEHGGWGLGAVPAADSTEGPLPWGIGWDGGTGTTWRSNPAQRHHRDPVHPTGGNLTGTSSVGGGVLGGGQRRCRSLTTDPDLPPIGLPAGFDGDSCGQVVAS